MILKKKEFYFSLAGLLVAFSIFETFATFADYTFHFTKQLKVALEVIRSDENPVTFESLKMLRIIEPVIFRDPNLQDSQAELTQDQISKNKKNIFIFGESAAYGYGLKYAESFTGQLSNSTAAKYHFINVARPGIKSADVAITVDRVIERFSADLLVLYVGNNEWISWRKFDDLGQFNLKAETVEKLMLSKSLSLLSYLFLRIISDLTHIYPIFSEANNPYYGLGYSIQHGLTHPPKNWPETKANFLRVYKANLISIIKMAKEKNIPVILTTVPFNAKLAPGNKNPQVYSWNSHESGIAKSILIQGQNAFERSEFDKSIMLAEDLNRLSPDSPFGFYLKAMNKEALGEISDAQKNFDLSRELMIGNLGSRVSTNQIIQEVAHEHSVPIVDLQKILQESSLKQREVLSKNYFLDDCHLNADGSKIVSDSLRLEISKVFEKN